MAASGGERATMPANGGTGDARMFILPIERPIATDEAQNAPTETLVCEGDDLRAGAAIQ